MDAVIRNARDLDSADRQALEHVLGKSLADDEQVVITVIASPSPVESASVAAENYRRFGLPEWLHVYQGLTDAEIEELERVILDRCHSSRPFAICSASACSSFPTGLAPVAPLTEELQGTRARLLFLSPPASPGGENNKTGERGARL